MQDKRECLIIDDDQDDQEIFLMCVESVNKNINCKTINDGVQAVALLTQDIGYTPNYIFIDVNMPKMNGIECLEQLRNIDRLSNSKIYMYSTTSQASAVEQSKKLGAADFIIKPSKTSELKEVLSHIF